MIDMINDKIPLGGRATRHERSSLEQSTDAYVAKGKLVEPTVCLDCGAVFHRGRWQWLDVPEHAHREVCPACQRIRDDQPVGYVTLDGQFLNSHLEEIRRLIQHRAEHERQEHPLKRIIKMESQGEGMLVTTTDSHLARGIGEALRHAYQGELVVDHVSGESLVRVHWSR
jgi:NMD protein affecting ribosome stability and mRNA decay